MAGSSSFTKGVAVFGGQANLLQAGLKKGDTVTAVIKSTEVMLMKE